MQREKGSVNFEPHIGRSVSLDHAAALLGVTRRTIYNRIRSARLQAIRTAAGQRVLLASIGSEAAPGTRGDRTTSARV
jgi:excisionase family DNA binding protein